MRVVLFAILLSVVQAVPSVPKHAPDSPNQSGQKDAIQHPKPIVPTPSSKDAPEKAVSEKTTSSNPTTPNAEQTVRVHELAPVSVTRDWIDKTGWVFSLVLVIVGIGGVWAALKTLSAIERQAETMDRTLRVDQRAWMGIVNIKIKQFLEPGHDFIVDVETKNTGKTPALRVVFHNRLQALLAAEQLDRTFDESDSHGTVMPDSKQIHSIGENHPVPAETFLSL